MSARIGRPTKLTPELHAVIVASIEGGNYAETAAALAGIHRDTFYGWMERGRRGEQPFADFSDAVTRARAKAEADAVETVRAGMADPKTGAERAQWYLERTAPDRFARRDKVIVENLVNEELTAAMARLRERLPSEVFQQVIDALADDGHRADDARGDGDDGAVATNTVQ